MVFLLILMACLFNLPLIAMEQMELQGEDPSHYRERQRVLYPRELPDTTLTNYLRGLADKNLGLIQQTFRTTHPDATDQNGLSAIAIAATRDVGVRAVPIFLWAGANIDAVVRGQALGQFVFPHNVHITEMLRKIRAAKQPLIEAVAQGNLNRLACDIKELAKSLSEQAYFISTPMEREREASLQTALAGGNPLAYFVGTNTLADIYLTARAELFEILLKLPLKIQDEQGNNLLHHAVRTNRLDTVRAVYELYPELAQEHNNEGRTPADSADGEIRRYLDDTVISEAQAETARARVLNQKGSCALL